MMPHSSEADPDTDLVIERLLNAPRERVWNAWTDPALLVKWFFPAGCRIENPSFDVREGGAYACDYHIPDGSIARLRGVFETLSPPDRMVFTHAWADENGVIARHPRVVVVFEAVGDKTRITLRQTGLVDAEIRNSHAEGWGQALGHLAALLAAD